MADTQQTQQVQPPTETSFTDVPVRSYGGFNINNFRSSVGSKSILRNNAFLLTFNPPAIIRKLGAWDMKEMIIRAEAVTLPGQQLMTNDAIARFGYGPVEKVPYNAVFNDISVSFLLDRDAQQYSFMHTWMQSIVQHNMTRGINAADELVKSSTGNDIYAYEVGYKSDYAVDMTILMYNEDTDKVVECRLLEAYPISIADTPVAWGQENDVVRLIVNFSYRTAFTRFGDPSLKPNAKDPKNQTPSVQESPNTIALNTATNTGTARG